MAREFRGGYYKIDHESFGAMMQSEQVRPPLVIVAGLIRMAAKANTEASSTGAQDKADGVHMADAYKAEKGPMVNIPGPVGEAGPRITQRVVNRLRYAAAREFGRGGHAGGRGTRDLRRAGAMFGDLRGEG